MAAASNSAWALGRSGRRSGPWQALLFVEPDQDAAPELTVVDIREDVARLGQAAQLLDGLLQGIVPLEGLQLGDDQRGPDQAVLE